MAARLTIPDDVVFEILDGEAVVLNLTSGIYFTLNPVATRVWQLIQERGELDEIAAAMLVEYDVAPSTLRADLEDLVSELVVKGLLRRLEAER